MLSYVAQQPLVYAINVAPAECVAQCKQASKGGSTIAYVVCAVGYLSLAVFLRVLGGEGVIPRVFGAVTTPVPGSQLIWRGRGSSDTTRPGASWRPWKGAPGGRAGGRGVRPD